MEIAALIELVVGALTGLHGVGWLIRGRWKVGLISLGLSLLVNTIFISLIIPSAGLAVIPQLSLQIGWGLFSANALNNELRKTVTTPPPPQNARYPQLPQPMQPMQPPYPPYPPYQQPTPQRQPNGATSGYGQPAGPSGYGRPAPPSGRPTPLTPPATQRAPQPPQPQFPTPYPQDAPTLRN